MLLNDASLSSRTSWTAIAGFSALLLGCQPKLEDGVYGCKTGACPSGWFCHASDQRCYAAPEELGAGDAGDGTSGDGAVRGDAGNGGNGTPGDGGRDGGTQPSGATGYAQCTSAQQCESGICSSGADNGAQPTFCSASCTSDSECTLEGHPGTCFRNTCLPGCSSDAQCTAPSRCYQAAIARDEFKVGCFEVVSAALSGTTTCTPQSTTSCPPIAGCAFNPTFDANGVCSMRCDDTGSCPANGRCIEVFSGVHHCLKPCQGDNECGSTLRCGTLGAGGNLCLPAGWSGRTPPLPVPSMM